MRVWVPVRGRVSVGACVTACVCGGARIGECV